MLDMIDALLRKWLKILPHPFSPADRRAGFRYDLSILQGRLATIQTIDPGALRVELLQRVAYPRSTQMSDYGLVSIGAFFAVFGLVTTVSAATVHQETRTLKAGKVACGTIVDASIESKEEGEENILKYRPVIRYQYLVEAQQYESTVLDRNSIKYGSSERATDAKAVLSRYPVGAEVQVYYDPLNPTLSALELPEVTLGSTLFIMLFGIGFILLGAWMAVVGMRRPNSW